MRDHIVGAYDGVTVMDNSGDTFVIYDPHGDLPPDRMQPFVTIVVGDHYDAVSRLAEPDAYRVNIGLPKARYAELFGPTPTRHDERGVWETGFDHATRDALLPHPIYAAQHWVCVVSPGRATLDTVRDLLDVAYGFAVRKYANHRARRT